MVVRRRGCLRLLLVTDGEHHAMLGVRDGPFHLGRRAIIEGGQLWLTGPSLKVFVMRALVEVACRQYRVAPRRGQ